VPLAAASDTGLLVRVRWRKHRMQHPMRCSRCGRPLRDESAVYDTVGDAVGPEGLFGQATAIHPVTICPECSRKRMKTFWMLIGLVVGVVLAIAAIEYVVG
jgi:uncharacterized protein with PIN domain